MTGCGERRLIKDTFCGVNVLRRDGDVQIMVIK